MAVSTTNYPPALEKRHSGCGDSPQEAICSGTAAFGVFPSHCTAIAEQSSWTTQLEQLGVRTFGRPEALYKALRTDKFLPTSCVIDLDWLPRNLVRSIDIRVPCPKLWVGESAPEPSDVKNFGVYHAAARTDELCAVITRLTDVDRSIMLPAGIVAGQVLPLLAADEAYRDRLQQYAGLFADSKLITVHGSDPLELQLVAQYLAVESHRERIWKVESEAAIHSTLRKIAQARTPGTDVTIILSPQVHTEATRELHKSVPAEYALVKLSPRAENPVDSLSLTLPRLSERWRDVENWVAWFVCQGSVEQGVAISDLDTLVESIVRSLGDDPTIEEIQTLCHHSVRHLPFGAR